MIELFIWKHVMAITWLIVTYVHWGNLMDSNGETFIGEIS